MTTTKMRKWYFVASADSVPFNEGRRFSFMDHPFALFNVGDGYVVIDGHCPHKQGPLGDGILSGKSVFCPLHNWKISLETGCALSGGVGQVKVYPVKVHENQIYAALDEGEYRQQDPTTLVSDDDPNLKDVGG